METAMNVSDSLDRMDVVGMALTRAQRRFPGIRVLTIDVSFHLPRPVVHLSEHDAEGSPLTLDTIFAGSGELLIEEQAPGGNTRTAHVIVDGVRFIAVRPASVAPRTEKVLS